MAVRLRSISDSDHQTLGMGIFAPRLCSWPRRCCLWPHSTGVKFEHYHNLRWVAHAGKLIGGGSQAEGCGLLPSMNSAI